MKKQYLQVLQTIVVIIGLAKFPIQLYLGVVEPDAIMEFVHSMLEVAEYFKRK